MRWSVLISPDEVAIRVSVKSCRQLFQGCSLDYLLNVCKGRCCGFGTVPLLPAEVKMLKAKVDGEGFLINPGKRCTYQLDNGLCSLHDEGLKPISCCLSPFTLNSNDTLVIKNRNRLFSCYQDKWVAVIPAYKAYASSLEIMFGVSGRERITGRLDGREEEDFVVLMDKTAYGNITYLLAAHRRRMRGL